ncbi:zonular occludens toxin domain-containing protein [Roseateles asaccharophilus]|uniref:Zona occludens toxin n=1 Tax=Roseateles asaccharophilus TaxID=582607 RepID=A0ABU2AAQ0_9BURK|nr:zonular occludens toxin domain-containing protein [Roseateles asaccharophilus]MDR7334282.1 zona occludens toxin [Roseateles asaccharophilus]
MAIHAITGVMGSGKSYEAVSEKIVPALRDEAARRVVTNIEGLSVPAIAAYINKPESEVEARIVRISYDRVSEPGFWYDPEHGSGSETVVQPGDLVVLDEVWRYFNRGDKLPEDAMRFFRMHRHYVSEQSGLTCDVVLINQSFRGIHQDIRDVVELQFQCRKLKALGRPQNYQVLLLEGGERKPSHDYIRTYSKRVFPLYSSYAGGQGKEAVDKRQSVFNTPFFKVVLPLFAVLMVFGVYKTYSYFADMGKPADGAALVTPSAAASSPSGLPTPPSAGAAPAPAQSAFSTASGSAADWRLVARYSVGGLPVVVMVNASGQYRTVTSGSYTQGASTDVSVQIPLDPSDRATPWSGPAPASTKGAAR